MSIERSARLAMPLLVPGQAQKELWHNEALALIDIAVQPVVQAAGIDTPAEDPAPGDCWIVDDAPTGAWSGRAGAIAGWTAGGWRFVMPVEGASAWVIEDGVSARFADGAWALGAIRGVALLIDDVQVIGAQEDAIAAPSGGATIDSEARAAIGAVLGALRGHGLIAT